jgi:hypothetical protein
LLHDIGYKNDYTTDETVNDTSSTKYSRVCPGKSPAHGGDQICSLTSTTASVDDVKPVCIEDQLCSLTPTTASVDDVKPVCIEDQICSLTHTTVASVDDVKPVCIVEKTYSLTSTSVSVDDVKPVCINDHTCSLTSTTVASVDDVCMEEVHGTGMLPVKLEPESHTGAELLCLFEDTFGRPV